MERNIFEAAANESNKSKPAKKITSKKLADTKFGDQDPEILLMLEEMRRMRLQLKNQLTDMYDLGGKHQIDMDALLKGSGFSPQEMEKAFQQSQQLENQIQKALPKGNGVTKRTVKSPKTLEKERKSKTLGARKKNWISVR